MHTHRRTLLAFASLLVATGVAVAQQPATTDVRSNACGDGRQQFRVQADETKPTLPTLDPTKARVYFLSTMPHVPVISTTVRVGLDGTWLGAVGPHSYMAADLTPGEHHLCASYQGKAALSDEPAERLLQLHLEAGKTYYIVYRGLFIRDQGLLAFLNPVDEDEGTFVLQHASHATSKPK